MTWIIHGQVPTENKQKKKKTYKSCVSITWIIHGQVPTEIGAHAQGKGMYTYLFFLHVRQFACMQNCSPNLVRMRKAKVCVCVYIYNIYIIHIYVFVCVCVCVRVYCM